MCDGGKNTATVLLFSKTVISFAGKKVKLESKLDRRKSEQCLFHLERKIDRALGAGDNQPPTFKGGAVWGVMQSLHNAMIGIGYALIVLFFALSLFKNTANFHELKRPEAAVHYLIRFVAAKTLVGYGMDIMLNIFSICNGVVSDMAAGMGGISQAMVALPGEVQSAIENVGFLAASPCGSSRFWAVCSSPCCRS